MDELRGQNTHERHVIGLADWPAGENLLLELIYHCRLEEAYPSYRFRG